MSSASALWDAILAKRGVRPRPAATADTGETEITKRVRDEEAQRAAGIFAACDLADCPERAAGFIADRGKMPGHVLAVLSAERRASRSRR